MLKDNLRLLPSAGPVPWRPTRRQFLAAAAAGLGAWPCRAGRWPNHRSGGPDAGRLRRVDDAFHARAPAARAALAVAYHGRLVYARGFGHADLERREPVRPASLFRIASISKPFTATAVLQLVEQGQLKLDQRVLPLLKLEPHLERGARVHPRGTKSASTTACSTRPAGTATNRSTRCRPRRPSRWPRR